MLDVLRFAVYILFIYRLAQLVALDDGPLFVFKRLRTALGRKAAGSEDYGFWRSAAELIYCPYCLGVWFSLMFIWLVQWPTFTGDLLLFSIGAAGGQAFLEGLRDAE